MARIMKQGLDYFPLNTDFVQDRIVRRILKREGDRSISVLLAAFSCIYGGAGYYVIADEAFYDDLSACLFESDAADVRRVLALAIDNGIFDRQMYEQYGILTSAHIQHQYLFCTKRRKKNLLNSHYALVEVEAEEDTQSAENEERESSGSDDDATLCPQNVTLIPQRKAKHSKAKHSKENPLLSVSPETGGTGCSGGKPAQEERGDEDDFLQAKSDGTLYSNPLKYTQQDVETLCPPCDGLKRNIEGLLLNLREFRIPPSEQYAIVLKSNYGLIGHPVWKGFGTLRESRGKIRLPGRYLLSLCE